MGAEAFLENYCNSSLWHENFTSLPYPAFTDCFQHVILVWIPCGFLFLFSPLFFYANTKSKESPLKWSGLHSAKLILSLLLLAAACSQLFYRVAQQTSNGVEYTIASFASPALIAVTCIMAIIMQEYQRYTGKVTSGILFQFWLLLLLCGVITCSDRIREVLDNNGEPLYVFEFTVFFCYYGLLLIIVVLHGFAEPKPQKEGHSPEANSSFLNKLFFWWFNPIITLGYRQPLTTEDTWNLEDRDMSAAVGGTFRKMWEEELKKSRNASDNKLKVDFVNQAFTDQQTEGKANRFDYKASPYRASIWKAMFKQYWKMVAAAIFYKLLNDTIQFFKPTLLSQMISFTEDTSAPLYQGYFIAVAMYVVAVVQAMCLQQYFHKCYVIGMQMRTSLITIIYDKALKISNSAKQESTLGEIVNLMSTDAQRLMDLMAYVNILWSGPYQIIISVVLLWQQLQAAVLAGLAVMVVAMPLNTIVIKYMRQYSMENMKNKDERMKLMNEVLNGMKVLKLYGWEPSFEKQIDAIREKELLGLRKIAILKAISSFLWNCTPFIVTIVSFGVYLALDSDNVLDSTTTFVSISLFNIIRFPIIMLPMVFTSIVQAQVSIKRITSFLLGSEIDPDAVNRNHSGDEV